MERHPGIYKLSTNVRKLGCNNSTFVTTTNTLIRVGSRRRVRVVRTRGGRLGFNYSRMCVSKSEGHGSFFSFKGSEMSENISLKMGVKFAASLDMGKN